MRKLMLALIFAVPHWPSIRSRVAERTGRSRYQWSERRVFTQVLHTETYGPGERNYTVTVPLMGKDGKPLVEGKYTAQAWLATVQPKAYSASVGFEIRHVF